MQPNQKTPLQFSLDFSQNCTQLEAELHYGQTFDLRKRRVKLQNRCGALYYIDGFVEEQRYEKILETLAASNPTPPEWPQIAYAEVRQESSFARAIPAFFAGQGLLLLDGYADALLIDARKKVGREISEPENDRVLRGAREGFVESLLENTALLRRRLRTPRLRLERFSVGTLSHTDVLLCYLEGAASQALVEKMRKRLTEIRPQALSFGQESLCEALLPSHWFNPFPKVRYTERPDAAAALLEEGKVLLLCDNSPACMILPVGIFDFMQESDDFYFPPITATYLRLLRMGVFFLTVFLTPVWYWLLQYEIPPYLSFLMVTHPYVIPIFVQLYLMEFAIDGLKIASLNTPSMLNNSLSIIGGLLLGDIAVQIGILAPQVLFYMAFVAIGNFAQPNYELGYAFKFMRLLMLALVGLFHTWGLIVGFVVTVLLIATNQTADGQRRYLYPLLPFDGKALFCLFVRPKLQKEPDSQKNAEKM